MSIGDRVRWVVLACFALVASRCTSGETCSPGSHRDCMRTSEAGVSQRGTQSCGADSRWSECVGIGVCSDPSGTTRPVYSRCASQAECGLAPDCAVCGHYAGVQNPNGYQVCYAYCQNDSDCAPTTPSNDVTPQCLLGQCMLLCHNASHCPADSSCMPWLDADTAAQFPGFDGLCE